MNDSSNSKSGIVKELGTSNTVIVSFGGINQGLGLPIFEFSKLLSSIDCDKYLIRDFNQAWYHRGVDDEIDTFDKLVDTLKFDVIKKYEKVIFIGNSMGAYASILFGAMLKVKAVLAFAPQTYIDRYNRLLSFDFRWEKQLRRLHSSNYNQKKYFDLKKYLLEVDLGQTEIQVYYSPKDRLDKSHALRLEGIEEVNLNVVQEGGHSMIKSLRKSGELLQIISSYCE